MENQIDPILTGTAVETEPIAQLTDVHIPVSPKSPKSPFDWTRLILPAAILIAGFMVSGSILYNRLAAGQAQVNQPAVGQPGQPVKINVQGAPFLGSEKAPVTVVEFGDFQCPFCRRYFTDNEPAMLKEYVNTGKVKFVWEDYAFLGQESFWSAEAARCANDQGKFWPYHDYLYAHQGSENSGTFTKVKLEAIAASLGLNTGQFNSCLSSDKYLSAVQQSTQYGNSIGVQGTPASFVNGLLVSGAVPYAQLKAAIDAALK